MRGVTASHWRACAAMSLVLAPFVHGSVRVVNLKRHSRDTTPRWTRLHLNAWNCSTARTRLPTSVCRAARRTRGPAKFI